MQKRSPLAYTVNTIIGIAIILVCATGAVLLILHIVNTSQEVQQKAQLQNNLYNSLAQ